MELMEWGGGGEGKKVMGKEGFDSGALHLDQVKLQFDLDHESGMPSGCSVYQQRDSNR